MTVYFEVQSKLIIIIGNNNNVFSLLVLEGIIIESRTEPRIRIFLLLVNKFSLLTSG
jgi:hypothetical protein